MELKEANFWLQIILQSYSHQDSMVQFSRSVASHSLRPHESQHTRPPCPSPTPRVHSDSRPSSQWCHPAISSSVVPFSSGPQSLPASESLPTSQLFTWGGQSTGVSALASCLSKKSQGWSPSEWTGCTCYLLYNLWLVQFENAEMWIEGNHIYRGQCTSYMHIFNCTEDWHT